VHARERRHAPQDLGAAGPEGAADVGDRLVGQPVAHAVGEARGDPPQPGVLAASAHAADHVPAVLQAGEETGDVRRVVLQVGVESDDDVAAGEAAAGGERRRLARVAPLADDPHCGVRPGEAEQDREAAVGAAVVDEDHLRRAAEGLPDALELGREEGQALLFVEHRDDEGELGRGHRPILTPGS